MSVASWCCKSFCVVPCVSFCTGHFVMVPLNMTYLHCLQHSLFEHLFNLYYTRYCPYFIFVSVRLKPRFTRTFGQMSLERITFLQSLRSSQTVYKQQYFYECTRYTDCGHHLEIFNISFTSVSIRNILNKYTWFSPPQSASVAALFFADTSIFLKRASVRVRLMWLGAE